MRSLLDVNVLVALLDGAHVHHRTATQWLSSNAGKGWASCPLTQNGCVRILSLAGYPNRQTPGAVAERLNRATAGSRHEFWPDSLSVLGHDSLRWDRVLTSRQITDAYLLALAVACGGRLVTLDRGISLEAVRGARPHHLATLVPA